MPTIAASMGNRGSRKATREGNKIGSGCGSLVVVKKMCENIPAFIEKYRDV